MTPKEAIMDAVANVLEKIGFLPPDGSPEYYAYGPEWDQYGDCRDCDDEGEFAKYQEIFCQHPPTAP